MFGSYGSEVSLFRDNLISRGDTAGVKQVAEIRGRYQFSANRFHGFTDAGTSVLALFTDALNRPPRCAYTDNTFERCASIVSEATPGLWKTALTDGNTFVECTTLPPK